MRDYSVNRHARQRATAGSGARGEKQGYPLVIVVLRAMIRFWRLYIVIAVAAASLLALKKLAVAGVEAAGEITIFPLSRVEIAGVELVDGTLVRDALAIRDGDGIALASLSRMKRAVEALPWVRSATVHRILPDRLQVAITERNPVAVVSLDQLSYLDDNGDVFAVPEPDDVWDLPVITGVTRDDMARRPAETRERLLAAAEFLAKAASGMPAAFAGISEINVARDGAFTLYTADDGVPLKLGLAPHGDKLADLSLVYAKISSQLPAIAYVDISVPGRVVVGYRQPVVANKKQM